MRQKPRLQELDCLRGIAAILVVVFHFTLGQPGVSPIFKLGCTGVELFFVISGFVIFLTIEKTSSYKQFLISRFARLYPAYWACVTITTLAIVLWAFVVKTPLVFPNLKDYAVNLTMFQYYFGTKNIDGVYWTLIIELLFYLFILIIYLLKQLRQVENISFVLVLCCLGYGTLLKSYLPSGYANLSNYLPLIVYFPLFVAGIVFYKIKFYRITRFRWLLLSLCLVTQIFLFDSTGRIVFITHMQYAIVNVIIFAAFLLYCFNGLHFVVGRVTLFTGKISYSLYLIHDFISASLLIPVLTHLKNFHINYWVVIIVIVGPVVILTATLINKFIEVPANVYLKRKL